MGALRFSADETHSIDLVKVELINQQLTSDILSFAPPTMQGAAYDLSKSWIQLELEVLTAAGNPVVPGNNDRILSSEALGDVFFSEVTGEYGGKQIRDESSGMGHIGSFYRKTLTAPAGFGDSGVIRYGAPLSGATLQGVDPANSRVANHFVPAPGYDEGFILSSCGEGSGYTAANAEGYRMLVGSSGPNDTRVTASAGHMARSLLICDRAVASRRFLTLKCRPENSLFGIKSLLPANVQLKIDCTRNPFPAQLCQHSVDGANAGPLRYNIQRCVMWLTTVVPVASAKDRLEMPLRMPTIRHRIFSRSMANQAGQLQETFQSVFSGTKPDHLLVCALSEEALTGGSTKLSTFASGRYASVTTDNDALGIASVNEDAPYATITRLSVNWGGERYPHNDYVSSDLMQEGLPYLYSAYSELALKMSGGKGPCMGYQTFKGYPYFCVNFKKEADTTQSSMDINLTIDRRRMDGTAAGLGIIRMVAIALYRSHIDVEPSIESVTTGW